MGDGMQMDTRGVAAVGHGLDATVDAVSRAAADAGAARFGPNSVAPDLRHHGVAYTRGMRELSAVVEAMAGSVTDLVKRFDSASRAVHSTDAAAETGIRAAGDRP